MLGDFSRVPIENRYLAIMADEERTERVGAAEGLRGGRRVKERDERARQEFRFLVGQ